MHQEAVVHVVQGLNRVDVDIRFFHLFHVLCPGGKFVERRDGVDVLRTDGVHYSPEGSMWFARKYGKQILALGLG